VSPIFNDHDDIARPSNDECQVRTAADFRNFLERRCCLSTSTLTCGHIIVHHDEAFNIIQKAIAKGHFSPPADLYHIDAHADLGVGLGDTSGAYILQTLIKLPVEQRVNHVHEGPSPLDPGNWLSYSIANRWVGKIWFLPPKEDTGGDRTWYFFPGLDTGLAGTELLEMIPISSLLELPLDKNKATSYFAQQTRTEPAVPFTTLTEQDFQLSEPPDLVIVCQSPGFTPPMADRLIDITREYLGLSTCKTCDDEG
jgi:hypothetical protein